MSNILLIVLGSLVGLLGGVVITRSVKSNKEKKIIEDATQTAQKLLEDAKEKAQQIKERRELEAQKSLIALKTKQEQSIQDKTVQLKKWEEDLKSTKSNVDRQQNELSTVKRELERRHEVFKAKEAELQSKISSIQEKLEGISHLSKEEAKKVLLETVKQEAKNEAITVQREIVEEAKQNAQKEAKKIIIQTIQRTASEHVIENAVSIFHLEGNDIKGQIIGREGRNVRAIEAATGVELNIDNTPDAIVISSFDPLRREIARLSLQRLVADGRIHPARIEEIVEKTQKQMEAQVMEIGQRTIIDLGIIGMHKDLIRMVGKMRFRSSYGQNLLMHSREVANLCSLMAAELQINPKIAKRAGLLHDIGKVPDTEKDSETPHALLGMQLAEKCGEIPAVCNAIGAHHDEIPMEYMVSPIIQACDAISGARPGARREVFESYIKRLKDLEDIALKHDSVETAYAIQAGRELRVVVQNEKVSDHEIDNLAFEIATTIQKTMTYPGQVKVTVIREKRASSVAR